MVDFGDFLGGFFFIAIALGLLALIWEPVLQIAFLFLIAVVLYLAYLLGYTLFVTYHPYGLFIALVTAVAVALYFQLRR